MGYIAFKYEIGENGQISIRGPRGVILSAPMTAMDAAKLVDHFNELHMGASAFFPGDDYYELRKLAYDFCLALLAKMIQAEEKYKHNNAWMNKNWRHDLLLEIRHHMDKGDPRDVAIYAAFAWYHQWSLKAEEGYDTTTKFALSALAHMAAACHIEEPKRTKLDKAITALLELLTDKE